MDLAKTDRALQAASAPLAEARASLAEAEQTYADAPEDKSAAAVMKAREVVALAEVRVGAAQRQHDAATGVHRQALESIQLAEAALADAQREAHLAELAELASLATFRSRTAGHFAALLAAEDAMREAAHGIEAAWRATNDAAAELRAAGRDVTDLDVIHLVGERVRARPSLSTDVAGQLNGIRHCVGPVNFASTLLAGFDGLDRHTTGASVEKGSEIAPTLRADLAALLSGRSWAEGSRPEDGRRASRSERTARGQLAIRGAVRT